MAKIDLSAEARAIESLIDMGQREVASTRLRAASAYFGRRPEYRYLLCLYDSKFRIRADRELLREVTGLVGEQPELVEATALLAELHARAGDGARADLFARLALDSSSPSARARAMEVLTARGDDEEAPPDSRVAPAGSQGSREREERAKGAEAAGAPASAKDPTELEAWFARARREQVQRRTPAYGVRALHSVAEMLLDAGKSVAAGQSSLSSTPLSLTRESLTVVDDAILDLRRQPGTRVLSKSDASRTMALAGFFLAVVLHELEANAVELPSGDGGCKVLLASGGGARPLLVAAAYLEGSGPSLGQTYDRLITAAELAAPPSSSQRLPSSGRMSSAPRVSSSPKAPAGPLSQREELALTRLQVESATIRTLERPTWPADPPPLELGDIATALANSPLGQEIALRSGAFLAPTPASIEALESYCSAIRGDLGAAPDVATWQPSDDEEELILAWGALLGETLIGAYGGVWECDPSGPSDHRLFRVLCQDRAAAWPMTQVYLRLKNGKRHDLIAFLAAVGKRLG